MTPKFLWPELQTHPSTDSCSLFIQLRQGSGEELLHEHRKWNQYQLLHRDLKLTLGKTKVFLSPVASAHMVAAWSGGSECHRMLLAPASSGTGPSLISRKLTFPRGGWGWWGYSWAPDPLPSSAWSQSRKHHFQWWPSSCPWMAWLHWLDRASVADWVCFHHSGSCVFFLQPRIHF